MTPARAAVVVALAAALVWGASALVARVQRIAAFPVPAMAYLITTALFSLVLLLSLRSEDARLVRELRVAWSGTTTARAQQIRRRLRAIFFLRWLSPPHGLAALLLSSGNADEALQLLETGSPLFLPALGEGLGALRELMMAASRATEARTEEARVEALNALLAVPPFAQREVERFRAFTVARAILEIGDPLTARDVAFDLVASQDADVRLFAEWLRAWFDLDDSGLTKAEEGERRRAALLATNAGARDLAAKLA